MKWQIIKGVPSWKFGKFPTAYHAPLFLIREIVPIEVISAVVLKVLGIMCSLFCCICIVCFHSPLLIPRTLWSKQSLFDWSYRPEPQKFCRNGGWTKCHHIIQLMVVAFPPGPKTGTGPPEDILGNIIIWLIYYLSRSQNQKLGKEMSPFWGLGWSLVGNWTLDFYAFLNWTLKNGLFSLGKN